MFRSSRLTQSALPPFSPTLAVVVCSSNRYPTKNELVFLLSSSLASSNHLPAFISRSFLFFPFNCLQNLRTVPLFLPQGPDEKAAQGCTPLLVFGHVVCVFRGDDEIAVYEIYLANIIC